MELWLPSAIAVLVMAFLISTPILFPRFFTPPRDVCETCGKGLSDD